MLHAIKSVRRGIMTLWLDPAINGEAVLVCVNQSDNA